MDEDAEIKASGVLRNYLEDSGLVDFMDGEAASSFEHVRPEVRSPEGLLDYVLQTFVDFGSEEMGGQDVLEFSTDREAFDTYAKIQQLNSALLTDSIMDKYGFDIDDPYLREDVYGGSIELGTSIKLLIDQIDYEGMENGSRRIEYTEGLTEKQVDNAIESLFSQ